MKTYARFGVIVASLALGAILIFLLCFSLPLFSGGHIWTLMSTHWRPERGEFGLVPMVLGSLWIALSAAFLALVMAMSIALSIDALPDGRLSRALYRLFMLFGSIPTVVYGFVGVMLVVPFVRQMWEGSTGMCILTASLLLSFVITPTMVLFFIDSFRAAPREFGQIVSALGGHRVQYQIYVLLPYASKSIKSGFILGFARAIGDTMIALMLAGNSINLPHSFGDSARTLTAHIALLFGGDFDSPEFRSIFASGLILFGIVVLLLWVLYAMQRSVDESK